MLRYVFLASASKLFWGICLFSWMCGAQAEKLIVGTEDIDYYPHYRFQSNSDKGFIWAILQEFARQKGHDITYRAYPVKRLHRELLDQDIDFIYPDNPQWQSSDRKQSAKTFSLPIVTSFGSTMVLASRKPQGLQDFRSVSVPHGFTSVMYASLVTQRKVSLVEVPDAISALQLVIKNRVDGADVEYNVAQHLLAQIGQQDALHFDPTLPFDPANFHVSTIGRADIILQLNDFISHNQELISTIKKQYHLITAEQLISTAQSPATPNPVIPTLNKIS